MKILRENEYSDSIDIFYWDDPNIKKLSNSSSRSEDAVIKVQLYNKNQFRFKVHNHCGYLKIGPNSYFVIPKMGESFLKTMFKAVFNPPSFILYQNELKQNNTKSYFDEMIAYLFIGSFNNYLSGRIRQGHISKSISTYKSSGKIDMNKSKEFFAYSSKPPTWLRNEWSKDTIFNKALRNLFLKLSYFLDVSSKTKNKLAKIGLELADSDYTGSIDYRQLLHQLDRTHENYKPLFELAVLLNFNSGISSGSSKSYSLLLPTWLLFEKACKSQITVLLSEFEVNPESSFTKRASEYSRIFKPDIIIKNKQGEIVKIGDCKYSINKECELKRDHLFQLNTYMDFFQHFESFILYPSETYKNESHKLDWGYKIDVINIPTNNYNDFSSALKNLLKDLFVTSLNVASA